MRVAILNMSSQTAYAKNAQIVVQHVVIEFSLSNFTAPLFTPSEMQVT